MNCDYALCMEQPRHRVTVTNNPVDANARHTVVVLTCDDHVAVNMETAAWFGLDLGHGPTIDVQRLPAAERKGNQ